MKYSVAITEAGHEELTRHLLQKKGQEDICFALYNLSRGRVRESIIIKHVILPHDGDRLLHHNVSFMPQYWDRVTALALEHGCGICMLHSHLGPGWQNMSVEDRAAERQLSGPALATTGRPLIGMTLATNQIWSARVWRRVGPGRFRYQWCESVRIVGKALAHQLNPKLIRAFRPRDEFTRTISAWGRTRQNGIESLVIGIVGLGSVGSILAEALLRSGIVNFVLVDFDVIERKNRDRQLGVVAKDIGKLKIRYVRDRLDEMQIERVKVKCVPYSVSDRRAIRSLLDCDVVFSCVDRPWPRFVLDVLSKANYIPVIDGGIDASTNGDNSNLDQARWKSHTVGPGRACMQCLSQYNPEDVALEQSGLLNEPRYKHGLAHAHWSRRGENVFAFSLGVAAMHMQQFLSLVLQPRGQYVGPKEYDFATGNIDFDFQFECSAGCRINDCQGDAEEANKFVAYGG